MKKGEMILFHGGCTGCTQQTDKGIDNCAKCCYFDADWDLPDLNNKPPSKVEFIRKEIKKRLRS